MNLLHLLLVLPGSEGFRSHRGRRGVGLEIQPVLGGRAKQPAVGRTGEQLSLGQRAALDCKESKVRFEMLHWDSKEPLLFDIYFTQYIM